VAVALLFVKAAGFTGLAFRCKVIYIHDVDGMGEVAIANLVCVPSLPLMIVFLFFGSITPDAWITESQLVCSSAAPESGLAQAKRFHAKWKRRYGREVWSMMCFRLRPWWSLFNGMLSPEVLTVNGVEPAKLDSKSFTHPFIMIWFCGGASTAHQRNAFLVVGK